MRIAKKIREDQDRDGMLRRSLERNIQLYTDKSHFVYELLQNAEDAKATKIHFIQYDNRLEVLHNGLPFTKENLQGLCDIGVSDKANNLNQIGEFGVGFKSVFGICETVRLYSVPSVNGKNGEYQPFSVEIRDFVTPEDIDPVDVESGYTTLFVFPYAVGFPFSSFKSFDELREVLAKRLANLGMTTLLFLRHLKTIKYDILVSEYAESGCYETEKKVINDHCVLVSPVQSKAETSEENLSFLKFTRPIDTGKSKRTVDIAFPVSIGKDGVYTFHKAKQPYISVYFPTETESKLSFVVQGPYRTPPNRTSVPADEAENKKLAQITAELLCDSMIELRDIGILNLSFLNILPLNTAAFDNSPLFTSLYKSVAAFLGEQEVLPGKNCKYVRAPEALMARGKELSDLFDNETVTNLLDDDVPHYWLSPLLTETGPNRDLYRYLSSELKIKTLRPEDFREYFNQNPDFLPSQNDQWLVRMYRFYETNPNLFSDKTNVNILDARIIKTNTGSFVAPYRKVDKSYLPSVFLPSEQISDMEICTVDAEIYRSCSSFFEKVLHLTPPDEYEYFVKSLQRRYADGNSISEEDHIADVKRAIGYLRNPQYADDMKCVISKNFRLRCRWDGQSVDAEPFFTTIRFPLTKTGVNLEAYFKNIETDTEDFYFIDFEFYTSHGISRDDLCSFDISENILVNESITNGEYYTGNPGRRPDWNTYGDFRWKLSMECLNKVLVYISLHSNTTNAKEKSQVIFQILQENIRKLVGKVYIGGSYVPDKSNEPAEIIKQLCSHSSQRIGYFNEYKNWVPWDGKWLYAKSGELVSQGEISKRELDTSLYGSISLDSPLYNLLGFKKDKIDLIEDNLKEYDKLPPGKQEAYFESGLFRKYGMTIESLDKILSAKATERSFEFPWRPVKNLSALKHHVEKSYGNAPHVKYAEIKRSIRMTSNEGRTYLDALYKEEHQYACQLCHRLFPRFKAVEIEEEPQRELDQMNLCLCPNCAMEYREVRRNESSMAALKEGILAWDEEQPQDGPVELSIGEDGRSLWFSPVHLAEVKLLLQLLNEEDSSQTSFGGST